MRCLQRLRDAEEGAATVIAAARARKTTRLKQVKAEAEVEIAAYRQHRETTFRPKLTCTPRGLRTVRTGYTYQPPACCTYPRHRAACPEAPCTVRTPYAYQPRPCRTYHVPWHLRFRLFAEECTGVSSSHQRSVARFTEEELASVALKVSANKQAMIDSLLQSVTQQGQSALAHSG